MRFPVLPRAGFAAAPLLVLGLSGPGWALTAEEVWTEMQAISERAGIAQRAASEVPGDGGLTLEGVTLSTTGDGTRITTLIETMTLRKIAPDTVEVIYPDTLRILMEGDDSAAFSTAEIALDLTEMATRVTGVPGALAFHYTAEAAALRLTEFETEDRVELPELTLRLSGLDVTTHHAAGLVETTGSAATLSGMISLRATDEDAAFQFRLDATRPGFETSGSALQLATGSDTDTFLADPTPYRLESRHAGLSLVVGGQIDGVAGGASFASAAGTSAVSVSDGQIAMSTQGMDLRTEAILPMLPLPLRASASELSARLSAPLLPDDELQPMALSLTLDRLELDEAVWAFADPEGLLPRDPASVELDLTGEGRAAEKFLSPRMADAPSLSVERLNINRLLLEALGARITGEGALAIDPLRSGPMPGVPALSGQLGLTAQGVSGLLDALAELGVLRAPDVMGARMVIAMLTTPGNAPDTLSAEIELKPDGGLVANGMRLR